VDMDISMDIHEYIHGYPRKICGVWSVDMDMDMDGKFHIHGKPGLNGLEVGTKWKTGHISETVKDTA